MKEEEVKVERNDIAFGLCECPFCHREVEVQYDGSGIISVSNTCVHYIKKGQGKREEEMLYPTLIFSEEQHEIEATTPYWVTEVMEYSDVGYIKDDLETIKQGSMELIESMMDETEYKCSCGENFGSDYDKALEHMREVYGER